MKKIFIVITLIIIGVIANFFKPIGGIIIDHYLGKLPPEPEILKNFKYENCDWDFDLIKSKNIQGDNKEKIKNITEKQGRLAGIDSALFLGLSYDAHTMSFYKNHMIICFPNGLKEIIYLKNFSNEQINNDAKTYQGTIYIDPDEPWKKFKAEYEIQMIDNILCIKSKSKIRNSYVDKVQYYNKVIKDIVIEN